VAFRQFLIVIAVVMLVREARGEVVQLNDAPSWNAAVGTYTTITFTEWDPPPVGLWYILNQFAHMGAMFVDGADFLSLNSCYEADGVGVQGVYRDHHHRAR
jgi:hypothetical protein